MKAEWSKKNIFVMCVVRLKNTRQLTLAEDTGYKETRNKGEFLFEILALLVWLSWLSVTPYTGRLPV